eukprot:m.263775 g.263775  ORF g.263775 m.263775 type:complete len:50 (-) comp52194_c0_seq1:103-252(-)
MVRLNGTGRNPRLGGTWGEREKEGEERASRDPACEIEIDIEIDGEDFKI